MRPFIVMFTLTGALTLSGLEAGVPKKIDVGKMIGLLKNSKVAKERVEAAEAIGNRGAIRASEVENAIEPLMEALKADTDATVRGAAAKALGQIAPDADKTVPLLTEALDDKATGVKLSAMQALAAYGPAAKAALPKLREIAKNKDDKKLSQAAANAAKSIAKKKG
jgi:HEAT repeat protein